MDIALRTEQHQVEDRSWLGGAHGTNATRSITLDVSLFTAGTHYPNGYIPSGTVLAERADLPGVFGPYAGSASEIQTVTLASATGGTFTLTFDGAVTGNIAFNATAAAVQTALEGLPNIQPGDVTVTGAAGGPYTITFGGQWVGKNVPQLVANGASLTGTSPTITPATTTGGGSAGTNGMGTPVGHLFDATQVRTGGATKLGAPLFTHGAVVVSKLPANSGYDANVKATLGRIEYR